jgi:excisionase family DNA binding protein
MTPHTIPTKSEEQDMLLNSAETCELLKISRPTLHRYVRQKLLHPFRLPGGRLRFRKSDVVMILALP